MPELTPSSPPIDPLEDEKFALPSGALEASQQEKQAAYTKGLASKLREKYPKIKDASDEEIFQVHHQLTMPDASSDEYWKVLGTLYSEAPKKPPLISVTEPSTLGAMVADLPINIAQDITAIPKALGEATKAGKLMESKIPPVPPGYQLGDLRPKIDPDAEVKRLSEKANAHLARGGAFALGLGAAGVVEHLVGPLMASLGTKFLPQLLTKVIKGSTGLGAYSGTYAATREAEKPKATPIDIWNAFQEGTISGAEFGALLGAGGALLSPVMVMARNAGKATAAAKTLIQSKQAAAKFANIFQPEWAPPEMAPKAFAEGIITELHGPDVAQSAAGQRAITHIETKVKAYQDNLLKTAFAEKESESGTGFLDTESPEAAAAKTQLVTSSGPAWQFGVKVGPGVQEVHNVFAPSLAEAQKLAADRVKDLKGEMIGEVEPQYNLRSADRRIAPSVSPTGEERRISPARRAEDTAKLQEISQQATEDLAAVDNMDKDTLVQTFKQTHPNVELPYQDTEQLRDFMRREARSQIQGVSDLSPLRSEAARAQVELASPAEITKAVVNPNLKEEFAALAESSASDAEIERVLQKSLQNRYGKPFDEMAAEGDKVYAGFDPSLIRKLASRMYQKGLGRIVPKELVQNAIDSVRGKPDARISIRAKTIGDRTISIIDNGTGMTPDIVKKELVDLGSSIKPENASGGFGLAKAALFANADRIEIDTVADVGNKRMRTRMQGSGKDWADPKAGLKIKTEEVDPSLMPTGTRVHLGFPEKDSEGNAIDWNGLDVRTYARQLMNYKRLDIPIDFNVDGSPVGLDQPPPLTDIKTFDTKGAKVTIYTGGKETPSAWPKIQILNRGIPQFEIYVPLMNDQTPFPLHIVADIEAKVDPASINYPFTTSREALSPEIDGLIKKFIGEDMAAEASSKLGSQFKRTIENAPSIGKWKVLDPTEKRDPGLMAQIANTSEYEPLLHTLQEAYDGMVGVLIGHHSQYAHADLFGFSTGKDHLGVNISGPLTTGETRNMILVNPWITLAEVLSRVEKGATPNTNAMVAEDFTWQLISTLEHELTHQVASGHSTAFAGHLTRNIGHLGEVSVSLAKQIYKGMKANDFQLIQILRRHLSDLRRDDAKSGDAESIFSKVSNDSPTDRQFRSNEGDITPSQESRSQSKETLPLSRSDKTRQFSPSIIQGNGPLPAIIKRVREHYNISERK
jgi:hypothetical protein